MKEIKIRENEKERIAYIGDGENAKSYPRNWSIEEIKEDYQDELKRGL